MVLTMNLAKKVAFIDSLIVGLSKFPSFFSIFKIANTWAAVLSEKISFYAFPRLCKIDTKFPRETNERNSV